MRRFEVSGGPRALGACLRVAEDDTTEVPGDDVPRSVDIRALAGRVEDQMSVPCCTGEAATDIIEAAYRRAGLPVVELSPLAMWSLSQREGAGRFDPESGSTLGACMRVAHAVSVLTEAEWPFNASNWDRLPPADLVERGRARRTLLEVRLPNLAAVLRSLADGVPVALGFLCPRSMLDSSSGVVRYDADAETVGGHAVSVWGYDLDRESDGKRGWLLCKNSWGTSWGLGGYFWLDLDFVYRGQTWDRQSVRAV